MTLLELIKQDLKQPPIYSTDIDFIDDIFNGGIQLGQLVTITGEQESGKTKLMEQILSNVSKGFKCLYFSLEFNKYQVASYFMMKLKKGYITQKQLNNIIIVTTDLIDPSIDNIIKTIDYHIKNDNITFIGLDSTLNLYHNTLRGEEETTDIFRQLQAVTIANNVLLFAIAQNAKQDLKDDRVSIFGSQKANHFTNIMFHLKFNRDENERQLIIAKNKQNGKYKKIDIKLNTDSLIFEIDSIIEEFRKPKIEKKTDKKVSLWEVIR